LVTRILNLTLHEASAEQKADGVVEPTDKAAVSMLLTFDACPDLAIIRQRATDIAALTVAERADAAMLGGALWLMAPLEAELRAAGIVPMYAFSVRDSVEAKQPDGSIRKTQVFRHAGWVRV
jgi:hypothetical protein